MPPNIEARLERCIAQLESVDDRFDEFRIQTRGDLDETKLLVEKFARESSEASREHTAKLAIRDEKMDDRVRSLEFWRWMLFGAFSVLTVFGSMAWFFTSTLMLDEIRNIRTGLRLPAPVASK